MALEVHPVAALFPTLGGEALAALAADIHGRGLLNPIVLDTEGRVLDGRNRLAACVLAEVQPTFTTYGGDDPVGYALASNLLRRDMTQGAKAMVVAKARLLAANKTQAEVATEVGVSRAGVAQAEVVLEWAPELADAVVAGASLDQAYKFAKERKQAAEDAEKAAQRQADALAKQERKREEALERQRDALRKTVESIGPEVPLPAMPSLPPGKLELPPSLGAGLDDVIDEQRRILNELIAIEGRLMAIQAPRQGGMGELYTRGVFSAVSQVIKAATVVAERHKVVFDEPRLRSVQ